MGFRVHLIAVVSTIGLAAVPGWGAERSSAEIKADSLRFLQDLRSENVKRLKDIDQTLSKTIEESGSGASPDSDVNSLEAQQKEHSLRQKFLDRLILQIDARFGGGDLRAFLERTLPEMAKVDSAQSSANSGLGKFLNYAADAMKRLPERKENILSFLEGYMRKSVSNPVPPDAYLSARNYTNGAISEAGAPLSRDEAGAYADRVLREMDIENSKTKTAVPRAR